MASISSTEHTLSFSDSLTLSQAANTKLTHSVNRLTSQFVTDYGAEAFATASIGGFSFDIIDEGASVETRRNTTNVSFGSALTDTGNDALVGRQIGIPVGFSPVVAATVNLEQRSTQRINSVNGTILARHESGATVQTAYNSNSFSASQLNLDLGLLGTWDIFALNGDAFGTFDADFGTSSTGIVGYQVGLFCEDVTDPDDGFGCVSEGFASITTPVAYVKNGTPFALNFRNVSTRAKSLGSIEVLADPVDPPSAVPLPAGAWMMLSGLGALAFTRRRTSRRKSG